MNVSEPAVVGLPLPDGFVDLGVSASDIVPEHADARLERFAPDQQHSGILVHIECHIVVSDSQIREPPWFEARSTEVDSPGHHDRAVLERRHKRQRRSSASQVEIDPDVLGVAPGRRAGPGELAHQHGASCLIDLERREGAVMFERGAAV